MKGSSRSASVSGLMGSLVLVPASYESRLVASAGLELSSACLLDDRQLQQQASSRTRSSEPSARTQNLLGWRTTGPTRDLHYPGAHWGKQSPTGWNIRRLNEFTDGSLSASKGLSSAYQPATSLLQSHISPRSSARVRPGIPARSQDNCLYGAGELCPLTTYEANPGIRQGRPVRSDGDREYRIKPSHDLPVRWRLNVFAGCARLASKEGRKRFSISNRTQKSQRS
ncbi:hypothetical protein BJY52DRAFT_82548 [Lactarius psammicola]|nr:hypothetical protein BJY52DRAFT_82548 [Lactarius psammicola]